MPFATKEKQREYSRQYYLRKKAKNNQQEVALEIPEQVAPEIPEKVALEIEELKPTHEQQEINKYENTVIYKIAEKNKEDNMVYIGHTTNLKRRFQFHKSCSNARNKRRKKLYDYIISNGGWEV